jgi:CheY-like chemotaxis protein
MIRRVGEPEAVSGIDSRRVWLVILSGTPDRQWRHAFLERVWAVGLFDDAGLRLADAAVSFELASTHLRAAVDHLDRCIAGANAACGLTDDGAGEAPEAGVILVVDDESGIVGTIAEILARRGYAVLEATDPREALGIVRSRRVDLLLTDVVMPVMNGLELARRVREARPAVKIVFMSAYAIEEALAWGAPFLLKPFSYESLIRTVLDALDRSPSRRPAPGTSSLLHG